MIDFIRDWWRGNLGGRSSKWRQVRRAFIKQNPVCAVCRTKKKLEVHHCAPFHISPELELDFNNLITLCNKHHYTFGHYCNYRSFNENIKDDALIWNLKIKNRP